jgi:nucleotide-binding universal stress UspA family protein
MVRIEKILCPVDFSDFSRDALDHAVALAGWYEAGLIVMHVVPIPTVPLPIAGVPIDAPAFPVNTAETTTHLEEWAHESVGSSNIPMEVIVTSGSASIEITRQAELSRADLLVLGTHGRSGFQRLFLGSVTEKVLRTTSVPVMTIPPPVKKPDSVRFGTILCPVDFSDESMRALEYALSLAKEADARIILLHVIEGFVNAPYANEFRNVSVLEYYEQIEEDARTRLADAVPEDARTWARPAERVTRGRAYREILQIADEEGANLIVMGVRGRGAMDRFVFGSTTYHVIRRAACPVLTLHV